MSWILIVAGAWTATALPLGLLLGRALRLADRAEAGRVRSAVPDFVPQAWSTDAASAR